MEGWKRTTNIQLKVLIHHIMPGNGGVTGRNVKAETHQIHQKKKEHFKTKENFQDDMRLIVHTHLLSCGNTLTKRSD